MCDDDVLLEAKLPLPLVARGKVRDIFNLGDSLLFVATDRISAFDSILGSGIPCKGRVLTQMSLFWFDFLSEVTHNHLLTAQCDAYPDILSGYKKVLDGRSMLVNKAQMVPVECVARGYLAGSGWKEYVACGKVCGIPLPPGLKDGDRLPEPLFTPATKAVAGHDENVPFSHIAGTLGAELAEQLRDLTLEIYKRASAYALSKGIILADSKFEFGFVNGELTLADEALTPDSSRFWPADSYKPGGAQVSYDKQFVRDFLETLRWDKKPPAPALPEDVVRKTSEKYQEAYRQLTGRDLVT